MNLLKKLRTLIRRPAVTVRELQDTEVARAVSPGRHQQENAESHKRDGLSHGPKLRDSVASPVEREIRGISPAPSLVQKGIVTAASVQEVRQQLDREAFFRQLNKRDIPVIRRPLGDIRAVRKMKHGHQSPYYRKSVKANVKPEEEEEA